MADNIDWNAVVMNLQAGYMIKNKVLVFSKVIYTVIKIFFGQKLIQKKMVVIFIFS